MSAKSLQLALYNNYPSVTFGSHLRVELDDVKKLVRSVALFHHFVASFAKVYFVVRHATTHDKLVANGGVEHLVVSFPLVRRICKLLYKRAHYVSSYCVCVHVVNHAISNQRQMQRVGYRQILTARLYGESFSKREGNHQGEQSAFHSDKRPRKQRVGGLKNALLPFQRLDCGVCRQRTSDVPTTNFELATGTL